MPKPKHAIAKKPRAGTQQANVRYPVQMLRRAKEAAEWEGINFSNYVRSALLRRVRGTEAERAREESSQAR